MNKLYTKLLFVLFCCALSLSAVSQQVISYDPESLPHRMTFEEELRRHEIGKDFYPTLPPAGPVRQIAEFEHMESVLVRYPFGIPLTLITEMSQDCHVTTLVQNQSQENTVRSQYQAAGVNMDNCEFIHAPTDSYWTRDYGPWFVVNGNNDVGICNFPYNRPRPNDNDIPIVVAEYLGIELYGMNLIHTGGNYMCDGISVAASTDLVWEENPTLTHGAIEDFVDSYLGIETYHVLPDPLGEYIKHIDCWSKFLDVDKVLVGQVDTWDPRYEDFEYVASYFAETACSYGYNYEVFRVYTPGDYPNTPYTNSLILNKKVFVPITGSPYDPDAIQVYEDAMPGYEIHSIMYNGWENTDALHCRAKGIADTGMLYVRHFPLYGPIHFADEFELSAEIIPYSEEAVYPDSLLIYYQVNGGSFSTAPLMHVEDYTYTGYIPGQPAGSLVGYYLHAADETGRSVDHPLIGAPDPHEFNVIAPLPDITVTPDSLIYTDVQQAIDGQKVYITNETDAVVEINDITNEGWDPFMWYIEPWPITFPYAIIPGDSLVLNVIVDLPVDNLLVFLEDTLFIETDIA
ncbi:MAG: agmatine deiminase family protein, partial [Bacteroidota bacterium]|nr:agmatine deiminase family protein [Bacteroidota bacterium]